jgi:hypothetical protein
MTIHLAIQSEFANSLSFIVTWTSGSNTPKVCHDSQPSTEPHINYSKSNVYGDIIPI